MAIFIRREGQVESVPRGTLSEGDLVGQDGTIIDAAAERPMGIIADPEPSENPPEMVDAHGEGTIIEDDAFDGVAVDTIVWSDGDGTYSTTDPAPVAGAHAWALGVVREIDTQGTDTGAVIEIRPQLIEGG